MAVNDEALFGIYNELQTLRCLKQIELGLLVSNPKAMSVSELNFITDMIANPKKYLVEDEKSKEDKK